MIGNSQALIWQFWQVKLHQNFAHIPRQLRHARGLALQRIAFKHMAVIFHGGAATRGVNHHCIQSARGVFGGKGFDIHRRSAMAFVDLAHMMG